jgi:putative sigma-54 modulation protein
MNITITGKDVKATEAIKDYVEKKMERVERYFEGDVDVAVTIKTEKPWRRHGT